MTASAAPQAQETFLGDWRVTSKEVLQRLNSIFEMDSSEACTESDSSKVLASPLEIAPDTVTAAAASGFCLRRFKRRWVWVFLIGSTLVAYYYIMMMRTEVHLPDAREKLTADKQSFQQSRDVNGPSMIPPRQGETIATRLKENENSDSAVHHPEDKKGQPSFPVIAERDDKVPLSAIMGGVAGGIPLHAAEALVCRESVVNFVINATDTKDECEGLIKAFDKTCSDDTDDIPKRQRRRRRRLWDKTRQSYRWQEWIFETTQSMMSKMRYLVRGQRPFFFPEEQLVLDAWEDARYLVQNNLDKTVHKDVRRHFEKKHIQYLQQKRRLQQQNSAINRTKTKSLDVPTNNLHVSGKTLDETLLLHQGDKVIEKATNQTKAAVDAAASSKAMSETTAAVSSVLNDPDSIEARTCCASILNVYHENCSTDEEEQVSDKKLFFVVFVMAFCGMVKSLIRHFRLLWLPEAAGCILVGVLSGYVLMLFPHHDISFDGNWFLRVLVPPIIFEAALNIDKRSFNRHIIPILIYAIAGTLMATFLTATIVHKGTTLFSAFCTPIPYVEALTFGALISSIDPIAVLSVLSNMGMTDTDTIYVVIFGESLLNDGVAIVLFHTLVHFLDENLVIDSDAVAAAAVHFFVVALGSLLIGVASGMFSTVYYWIFHDCQTPLVEVLMFFCWALLPYYVCDGIGWSGIVAAVATGFVMDLHIVGQKPQDVTDDSGHPTKNGESKEARRTDRVRRRIFSSEGHLSEEARTHIRFVTEIISTMMETAIFAYLGLFLFSHRYHWNIWHALIAIFACCLSRGIMIPSLSFVANWMTRIQQRRIACRPQAIQKTGAAASNPAGVVIDKKMQLALWFAGLRGAMSFALVEHIPLYDSVSGEGTRLKPELKAMTSASIMFTVFVLGGYTYYMMLHLGIAPSTTPKRGSTALSFETASLLSKGRNEDGIDEKDDKVVFEGNNKAVRRQWRSNSEIGPP